MGIGKLSLNLLQQCKYCALQYALHTAILVPQVTTPQGQVTKHVKVEVLNDIGLSCPQVTQVTPKGKYVFEEMLAGIKAKQPCQVGGPEKFVTYMCDRRGVWKDLNTTACAFTSDLTRGLEKLAQVGHIKVALEQS